MNLLPSNYSQVRAKFPLPLQDPHALQTVPCLFVLFKGGKVTTVLGTKLLSNSFLPGKHLEPPLPSFLGVLDHSGCYSLQRLFWTTRATTPLLLVIATPSHLLVLSMGLPFLQHWKFPWLQWNELLWTSRLPRISIQTSNVIGLHVKLWMMVLIILG